MMGIKRKVVMEVVIKVKRVWGEMDLSDGLRWFYYGEVSKGVCLLMVLILLFFLGLEKVVGFDIDFMVIKIVSGKKFV